jgi:hypothetical protein
MTKYRFEYIEDGRAEVCTIAAVDSLDAFDAFRLSFPCVIISNIWVEAFQVA